MNRLAAEGKYRIEDPLRDGHTLRCFNSALSLRVVRILAPEGQLVGYGEAPQFEFAVTDAAENYITGEDYGVQYRNVDARYPHAVYGSPEVSSPIESELYRGSMLLARWSVDHVVAELHSLTQLPIWSEDFNAVDALPLIVEQFGRRWFLEPSPGGGTVIRDLSSQEGKNSDYADLMRVGEGETLGEAIDAALTATSVESNFDQFKVRQHPPDSPFNIHFDVN